MKNKLFSLVKISCLFAFLTFAANAYGQTNFNKNSVSARVTSRDSIQKIADVKILEKPPASYPVSDTGTICIQGVVRLRVQFLASGKIGKIQPVSRLGYGLTESAVEAAKKIKFEPATQSGQPVTVTKVIEYSFTFY